MRWLVHVFARLAITATCTNSAAALDAHIEPGKYTSSANILWKHLMSNSSQSVNRVARLYVVPGSELRFKLQDKRGVARDELTRASGSDGAGVNSVPASMSAMTPADHQNGTFWSSIFACFMEGFALYGASYGSLPNAIATSPVESCPAATISAEASDRQLNEISWRERRKLIAIVSSTPSPGAPGTEFDDDTDRAGARPEALPENTARSSFRNWLTKPWSAIASHWAHWHREREIKKAVAGLAEFDEQTWRYTGIPTDLRSSKS
jgi:hypothetical protein